ncbi:hypothetical protein [Candidatus Entotheonella palauensis]|uniref:Uncharacterized protein n=1 Tax=Candidatus Entotheonella gemina TaxID=1429439 RepID=W4MDB9_9BACT|nr:hypothetical protein [Candidatus Entotheonella palauensis]ETX07642.1 MAG: hypothetical protein ETSY2_10075 [Candidatus Entotheonella gemina]
MNDGAYVLEWARQNRHSLTWVADRIGYSRQHLSQALHNNDISPDLSAALLSHFGLRVTASSKRGMQRVRETHRCPERRPAGSKPGRPAGFKGRIESKLDAYLQEIEQLLELGVTQRFIASRYQTTESNLSSWMKRRGLKRRKIDE